MNEPLVFDDEKLRQLKLELSGLILKLVGRCQSQTNSSIRKAVVRLPDIPQSHLRGDVRAFLNARNRIFDPKQISEEKKP